MQIFYAKKVSASTKNVQFLVFVGTKWGLWGRKMYKKVSGSTKFWWFLVLSDTNLKAGLHRFIHPVHSLVVHNIVNSLYFCAGRGIDVVVFADEEMTVNYALLCRG